MSGKHRPGITRLGVCSVDGCPNLTEYSRCDQHRRAQDRAYPRARSIYWDPRWKKVRRRVLERDGHVCVIDGEPATDIDHIVPIDDGGAPFDLDNLRSLCHACHSRATMQTLRERGAFDRPQVVKLTPATPEEPGYVTRMRARKEQVRPLLGLADEDIAARTGIRLETVRRVRQLIEKEESDA